MSLSMKEFQAISAMANLVHDFLPGSGNAAWKGHVSFKTIAEKVGVGNFWQPGSKMPMINALLQRTLEHRRDHFERLILEIVRGGIAYRQKQQNAIRADEIKKLNGYLLNVGFKFPDLWDQEFLSSLGLDSGDRAKSRVDDVIAREQQKAAEESIRSSALRQVKEDFFALHQEASPQAAGLKFEKVLNQLFELAGLAPRQAFRVVGEQIDGSFDLDHETYLVEAKWEKESVSESALLVFRGKIEGKSAFTRGLFISLNGVTDGARHAITQGKQPTFFVIDGYDLTMVLSGQIALADFLRERRRLLAEEGKVVVPFPQLWLGSRA